MADTPKLRLTLYVLTTPNLVVRRRVCMSRGTLNWGALGCGACLLPKKRPPPRVKNPSAFFRSRSKGQGYRNDTDRSCTCDFLLVIHSNHWAFRTISEMVGIKYAYILVILIQYTNSVKDEHRTTNC